MGSRHARARDETVPRVDQLGAGGGLRQCGHGRNFHRPAVQSNDPALIREWVKARTGMDVPLAKQHAVQLTGARVVKTDKIEIAYRSAS